MSDITVRTVLKRSDTIVSTDVADRTSMMDIEKGLYFGLEDVGARVWALLETPRSVGDLRDQLMREFDVDAETCETDLRRFVGTLLDDGLLRIDGL